MKNFERLTVYEYTTPSPHFVEAHDSAQKAIEMIQNHSIRHIPVTHLGQIVGIISQRDFGFRYYESISKDLLAKDLMTEDPYIVDFNTPLEEVAYHMSSLKIGSAIVKGHEGELLGIFTSTDALNALIEIIRNDVEVENEF